jgi:hypothetical protein
MIITESIAPPIGGNWLRPPEYSLRISRPLTARAPSRLADILDAIEDDIADVVDTG